VKHRNGAVGSPRVLILIATQVVGGPGKNLLSFLKRASAHELFSLCAFARRSSGEGDFIRVARRQGLQPDVLTERFRFDPGTVVQALQIARSRSVDVIQSHEYKSHTVAFLVSRILGIPWVAFAHGWTRDDRKVELFHSIDRVLLKRADRAVAVSNALRTELAGLRGDRPTDVVWNSVDRNELPRRHGGDAVRKELSVGEQEVLIGAVGRLSNEKGQEVLIRAYAQAAGIVPGTQVVVVGDGPNRRSLEGLADKLGVGERIHFVGHQRATGDYYEAMDLLVLPSYSEGLPNAVLEAMALGTPVLASDVGGVREIVTDGENGWLVAPGRSDLMAREIARHAERQSLAAFGRIAGESLFPRFDPGRRAREIRAIYRSMLEPR